MSEYWGWIIIENKASLGYGGDNPFWPKLLLGSREHLPRQLKEILLPGVDTIQLVSGIPETFTLEEIEQLFRNEGFLSVEIEDFGMRVYTRK